MNLALDPATHAVWQRLAGTVVADKYRLDEPLGAGSQGMVWRAHNLDLDLPVAIKLLLPLGEVGLAPNRLFREARAAATLGHPGIVRIFDFGRSADGMPYLTMELLQGVSLSQHLQTVGKLSPEVAVRLILPIADALSAAHAQGIVHRDVKPDNILLAVSGGQMQPKLLDFGIARVADGEVLTQAGCVIGTPNYLPPEQARGLGEVDARADVWALCATLYECVTGAVPFAAATWIDVLRRIIDEAPDPIVAHGVNDVDLWRLIRKGLAKNPDDRWSSVAAFARAASRWLLARGVTCDICGVSVESRWLKAPTASMLASGETSSGVAWWEEEAPVGAPRRRLGRHPAVAITAGLLCVAATVGGTRANGVFTAASIPQLFGSEAADGASHVVSPERRSPHDGSPHDGSPHGVSPHGVSPHDGSPHGGSPHDGPTESRSPIFVSPEALSLVAVVPHDVVDAPRAADLREGEVAAEPHLATAQPPGAPAPSSSTAASSPAVSTTAGSSVAAGSRPGAWASTPTSQATPPKPTAPRPPQLSARSVSPHKSAAPARDTLDLMNPY